MSGQETEVKFFVQDLKRIEMRLQELEAHLIQPRVHEVNLRFDNEAGELRKNFKVLRLRQDTDAKFTFKGPSEERVGGVLSRKEIEFTVSSFEAAKEFLELLGFVPVIFYEKYRTTYELLGVHIMLDELPYGTFVEIEGEDIETLQKVANLLGLNWNAMVKAGYHALFERITEKYDLEYGQLSFEALKSITATPEDFGITYSDIK
ncbi:MAG: class IV adenylate cyclase [Anaerolineales bacterium]